jgi:peptidoglycan/LPS O-acetylase OafA/YrhL
VTETRRDWFPGLAAVRALGATCVLGTHAGFYTGRTAYGPFAGTLGRLDVGVALFFVLTGFLLFRPYVLTSVTGRSAPSTGRYLQHRALRILPAYWLVVVVCMVLLPPLGASGQLSDIAHHLTLTQIYGLGIQHAGLTQAWSLCVEVSFYLALPLLARLVLIRGSARTAWLLLAFLGVASAAWNPYLTATDVIDVRIAGYWLPSFLDWFVAGMALALAQVHLAHGVVAAGSRLRRLEDLARSPGSCWAAAVGVFAIATSAVAGPTTIRAVVDAPTASSVLLKNVLYLLVAVLVVLPLVLGPQHEGLARQLLSSAPMQWLGEISYGIFLWHLAVLEGLLRLMHRSLFTGSWLEMFALAWCLTIPLAWASYRFVERPLMTWRRRPVVIPSPRSSADQIPASPMRQSA